MLISVFRPKNVEVYWMTDHTALWMLSDSTVAPDTGDVSYFVNLPSLLIKTNTEQNRNKHIFASDHAITFPIHLPRTVRKQN